MLDHIAFRYLYSVGTQDIPIAARWLAARLEESSQKQIAKLTRFSKKKLNSIVAESHWTVF